MFVASVLLAYSVFLASGLYFARRLYLRRFAIWRLARRQEIPQWS